MSEGLTLVTSFYNHYDRFLSKWIDSVLSSTQLPDEIILLVSGDQYDPSLIREAEDKLEGKVPYKTVYRPHLSMGKARNNGVKEASGEWIMYLNVDDELISLGIERIKKSIGPDCDILIGDMIWEGKPPLDGIKRYKITRESILAGKQTNDHSSYRKSFWEKSPYIEYSGDVDMAFWLGLVMEGARIKSIQKVLTKHLFRPDAVFAKYSVEDRQEIRRMIKIWRKEGVHSKRFDGPEYLPEGDYNFKHETKVLE